MSEKSQTDFSLDKDDTCEPITNSPGSEHMISEFNKRFVEEYKIKTVSALESVIEKRNDDNENNANTVRDRNTTADIVETGADGDDDDEQGNSEEVVSENAMRMRMRMRMRRGDKE